MPHVSAPLSLKLGHLEVNQMLQCLLAPASLSTVKQMKKLAFGSATGQGVTSIAAVIAIATNLLDDALILQSYMFIATAVAFILALPLIAFPRVLSVSIAQLGVGTSFILIAYALSPVFIAGSHITFSVIFTILVIVITVLFSSGIKSIFKLGDALDKFFTVLLVLAFMYLWFDLLINVWSGK